VISREEVRPARVRRTAGLTTRAIALAVVLLILTISYASSLRVYLNQRRDIAETQQQIIESQQRIGQLSDEITRWNDPNYVKTQARIRLGWVMPGETGYRVVGPDGKPVTGDTEIAATGPTPKTAKKAWYDNLWGSVEAADNPRPVTKSADDAPPITEKTKPSSRPSASPTR
jgi:cell division protein FtsB